LIHDAAFLAKKKKETRRNPSVAFSILLSIEKRERSFLSLSLSLFQTQTHTALHQQRMNQSADSVTPFEGHDDGSSNSKGNNNFGNKKGSVCEGFTDDQRRQIRTSQRLLRRDILAADDNSNRNVIVNNNNPINNAINNINTHPTKQFFGLEEARAKNNAVFENSVFYVRESILDADNLEEIARMAVKKIDRMAKTPSYDANRVVNKLIEKFQCQKTKKKKKAGEGRTSSSFSSTKSTSSYVFDWYELGVQAGLCFNTVPSNVTFLSMMVDMDEEDDDDDNGGAMLRRRRGKKAKKGNDAKTARVAFNATAAAKEDEETNVEELIVRPIGVRDTSNNSTHSNSSNSSNVDRLAVVTENIEAVQQALVKAVRESYRRKKREIVHKFHGSDGDNHICRNKNVPRRVSKMLKKNPGTCAIGLLFDPKSFTQTVENVYNYSCLVNKGYNNTNNNNSVGGTNSGDSFSRGYATISVRENVVVEGIAFEGGPICGYVETTQNGDQRLPPARQAIVSLTMRDWRDLTKAYGVQSSGVVHRTGSAHYKVPIKDLLEVYENGWEDMAASMFDPPISCWNDDDHDDNDSDGIRRNDRTESSQNQQRGLVRMPPPKANLDLQAMITFLQKQKRL